MPKSKAPRLVYTVTRYHNAAGTYDYVISAPSGYRAANHSWFIDDGATVSDIEGFTSYGPIYGSVAVGSDVNERIFHHYKLAAPLVLTFQTIFERADEPDLNIVSSEGESV